MTFYGYALFYMDNCEIFSIKKCKMYLTFYCCSVIIKCKVGYTFFNKEDMREKQDQRIPKDAKINTGRFGKSC